MGKIPTQVVDAAHRFHKAMLDEKAEMLDEPEKAEVLDEKAEMLDGELSLHQPKKP